MRKPSRINRWVRSAVAQRHARTHSASNDALNEQIVHGLTMVEHFYYRICLCCSVGSRSLISFVVHLLLVLLMRPRSSPHLSDRKSNADCLSSNIFFSQYCCFFSLSSLWCWFAVLPMLPPVFTSILSGLCAHKQNMQQTLVRCCVLSPSAQRSRAQARRADRDGSKTRYSMR